MPTFWIYIFVLAKLLICITSCDHLYLELSDFLLLLVLYIYVFFRCGRGTLLFQTTHILTLLNLPRAYAKWTYNLRFMYFDIIVSLTNTYNLSKIISIFQLFLGLLSSIFSHMSFMFPEYSINVLGLSKCF